ncbi:MAG: DNA helicase RecQ [Candidatus Omnitrophota bacterium]
MEAIGVLMLDGRIKDILKKYWGYDDFRPLQKEAMESVLQGRDSLVVLPTGGGKSLCFQAPAMSMPGAAVVVSPLISLMKDQVDALAECGVPAARIDSGLSYWERDDVFSRLDSKTLKILYLSPERLFSNGFLDYLKKIDLSFVAIDEAHCVSMWGHDFRPEYRQLSVLKEVFPDKAVHAYTATAASIVRKDIVEQLHLTNPEILVGSFDRPNLVYKVARSNDIYKQIGKVIERHRGESGIIYCIRRADAEEMSDEMKERGVNILPYHAGLDDAVRKQNQDAFIQEKIDVIAATVAFGMGIDKSNVRFVVHAGMPKSLEHYQQESGRAGRDGLEAECCLFYSNSDYSVWCKLLEKMPAEPKKIAIDKLNEIYDYCTGVVCRRKTILDYFGEDLDKENCAACDVCLGELDVLEDSLVTAQKILSCVKRLGERFGGDYTASVLIGSNEKRIEEFGHNQLTTYSLLSQYPKRIVRDWIEQLAAQGCLRKTGEFNVLNLTEKGWRVIRGQDAPRLLQPSKKAAASSKAVRDSWAGVDRGLFEALRVKRRELANNRNISAFVVFSDAALRDMARRRPSTQKAFLQVEGVGEKKKQLYGDIFVSVIKQYCAERSLKLDVMPPSTSKTLHRDEESAPKPSAAKRKAFKMFSQGASVAETAATVERALSTAYQYLEEYIGEKRIVDPSPWVDKEKAQRIEAAASKAEDERLKPIYDALNGEIPYEEIRIVMACLRNRV